MSHCRVATMSLLVREWKVPVDTRVVAGVGRSLESVVFVSSWREGPKKPRHPPHPRAMSTGGGTTGAKHLWAQLSSIRHPLEGEPPGALVPGFSSAAKPLHPTLYPGPGSEVCGRHAEEGRRGPQGPKPSPPSPSCVGDECDGLVTAAGPSNTF